MIGSSGSRRPMSCIDSTPSSLSGKQSRPRRNIFSKRPALSDPFSPGINFPKIEGPLEGRVKTEVR
jgi:hypothetical protein